MSTRELYYSILDLPTVRASNDLKKFRHSAKVKFSRIKRVGGRLGTRLTI